MTEAVIEQAPTKRVGRGWAIRFNVAWVGVMVALYGPIEILLPNQAESISPDHKEYVLGLVTSLGAAASMVANPVLGLLSDRTRSRFGQRAPWIACGIVATVAGLLGLWAAGSVLAMVVAWCWVQTAASAAWAPLTAVVPDQVPVAQRGSVSGWLGFAQMVGIFLAIALVTVLPSSLAYPACAVVMAALIAPFLLIRREPASYDLPRPEASIGTMLRGMWVSPREHPDFAWAWLTRLLINLGNTLALVYLLYFLRDSLGRSNAEGDLLVLSLIDGVGTAVAVVLFGAWSDRIARRRIFVVASGVIMAVAALLVVVCPSMPMLYVTAFVLGIGFGIYTAVDFALISEVLPRSQDHGKDMGTLNIAATLPQVLAPAIAAPIVAGLGGYSVLFAVAGLMTLAGAAFVNRITSVR